MWKIYLLKECTLIKTIVGYVEDIQSAERWVEEKSKNTKRCDTGYGVRFPYFEFEEVKKYNEKSELRQVQELEEYRG